MYWHDLYNLDIAGLLFSELAEWVVQLVLTMLYVPDDSEKKVLEDYRVISSMFPTNKYTLKILSISARRSW